MGQTAVTPGVGHGRGGQYRAPTGSGQAQHPTGFASPTSKASQNPACPHPANSAQDGRTTSNPFPPRVWHCLLAKQWITTPPPTRTKEHREPPTPAPKGGAVTSPGRRARGPGNTPTTPPRFRKRRVREDSSSCVSAKPPTPTHEQREPKTTHLNQVPNPPPKPDTHNPH